MRLNLFIQDNRLCTGVQCSYLGTVNYNDSIPWERIHEVEHFLNLTFIICSDCGAETLLENIGILDEKERGTDEVRMFNVQNVNTVDDFLEILSVGVSDHFEHFSGNVVDAAFLRNHENT